MSVGSESYVLSNPSEVQHSQCPSGPLSTQKLPTMGTCTCFTEGRDGSRMHYGNNVGLYPHPFMWKHLWHENIVVHITYYYSFILSIRICKIGSKMVRGTLVCCDDLTYQITRSLANEHLWDLLDKLLKSMEALDATYRTWKTYC